MVSTAVVCSSQTTLLPPATFGRSLSAPIGMSSLQVGWKPPGRVRLSPDALLRPLSFFHSYHSSHHLKFFPKLRIPSPSRSSLLHQWKRKPPAFPLPTSQFSAHLMNPPLVRMSRMPCVASGSRPPNTLYLLVPT